jgi:hypothetical protein
MLPILRLLLGSACLLLSLSTQAVEQTPTMLTKIAESISYHFNPLSKDNTYTATNHAQQLRFTFKADGLQVNRLNAKTPWHWQMRIHGYGYGNEMQALPAANLVSKKNRLEYQRDNLIEWYINEQTGLEQGFTLKAPPQPRRTSVPLRLAMNLDTNLTPQLTPDKQAIAFRNKTGETVFHYDKLHVFDAQQQKIPAQMALIDTETVVIEVDDRQAVYPLTIDPLLVTEKAILDRVNGKANNSFGYSVAIDGDIAAIGANGANRVYIFEKNQNQEWIQKTIVSLYASNTGFLSIADFGQAISLHENTLIVGARGDDTFLGSAYVYERTQDGWVEKARLMGNVRTSAEEFGAAVSVNQDIIVVGAPKHTHSELQRAGAAYIFQRVNGVWQEQAKLTAPDAQFDDRFAHSVAIDNNTIVVGARNGEATYVFTLSDGQWMLQQKLIQDESQGQFGIAVAISGNVLVVGAKTAIDMNDGIAKGAAYVFENQEGNWQQRCHLLPINGKEGDEFGVSVSIKNQLIMVGAEQTDKNGADSGSVYLYQFNNGQCTPIKEQWIASDTNNNDYFGKSVALSGNTFLVGAPYTGEHVESVGSAYLFQYVPGTSQITESQKLTADETVKSERFGQTISIAKETIAVGVPLKADNGNAAGGVYIYHQSQGNWLQQAKLVPDSVGGDDMFGFSVSLGKDMLAVGAPLTNDWDGSVYLFQRSNNIWELKQPILKPQSDSPYKLFGIATELSENTLVIGAPLEIQYSIQLFPPSISATQGTVCTSEYSNDEWTACTPLSTMGELTSGFGISVALSGDTLVVGAPSLPISLENILDMIPNNIYNIFSRDSISSIVSSLLPEKRIGKVYIFERTGNNWLPSKETPTISSTVEGDLFGATVAIHDNTLAVLAPNTPNSATVYLYERPDSNSSWSLKNQFEVGETMTLSSTEIDELMDMLGTKLSLNEDTLLVGAPRHDGKGIDSGALYLFKRRKNGWVQEQMWQKTTTNTTITSQEMSAESTRSGDKFGIAIALYENNLLVGAPQHDPNGVKDSGAVHIFEMTDLNSAPKLDNNGDMRLTPIDEDIPPANNLGTTITALIASAGGDRITDIDTGALEGIAIIAANNSQGGIWQYSLDNGNTWIDLGTPSDTNARLLAADNKTRLRFLPNQDFNTAIPGITEPKLTFYAWDQTDNRSNGDTADVSSRGDPTPFSTQLETATISINAVSDPLILQTIGNQSVSLDDLLTFIVKAYDPKDNPANQFIFSLSDGLMGATIDSTTGKFTWLATQPGTFTVTITATETNGSPQNNSVSETIQIVVGNTPPELEPIGPQGIMLNQTLTFQAKGTDEQNNPLSYRLLNAPPTATINPITGEFNWTPTEVGTFTARIVVEDSGGLTDDKLIEIQVVADVEISPITLPGVTVGNQVDLMIKASHPSENPLNYSLIQAPPGAQIDASTGKLTWIPSTTGDFELILAVTEPQSGMSTQRNIAVNVEKAITSLELSPDSPSIFLDSSVGVTGQLHRYPKGVSGLKDVPLQLEIITPEGKQIPIPLQTIDEKGRYEIKALPPFIQEGDYILQTRLMETETLQASQSPPQKVSVSRLAGYALLIQGRVLEDEQGLESHNKSLNRVYRTLKKRGFIDDNIEYLNYDTDQTDIQILVDDTPGKENIQAALTRLQAQMNKNPGPLYIIQIDHGGVDGEFYLATEEEPQQAMSPQELDSWLTELESGLNPAALEKERVLISGACYSGSYVPTLSKPGRVIVTSTAATEESYKGPKEPDKVRSGEFFVEALFAQLGQAKSLKHAFEIATESIELLTRLDDYQQWHPIYQDYAAQHPLLDDNHDQIGNNHFSYFEDSDGHRAQGIYLGLGPKYRPNDPNNPAEILEVTPTRYLSANQSAVELFALVNHPHRVENSTVYVEIRSPSLTLTPSGSEQTGQLTIELQSTQLSHQQANRFAGTFNGFTEPGRYEIFYFVYDQQTKERSPLKYSLVYKNINNNQAPESFELLTPEDDSETPTVVILVWDNTVDPEGHRVTYRVEVATDPNFTQLAYQREGLTIPSLLLDKQTPINQGALGIANGLLDDTRYYWRVFAVDTFGAKTPSTSTFSFLTNDTNLPPSYLSFTLMAEMFNNLAWAQELKVQMSDPSTPYLLQLDAFNNLYHLLVASGVDPFTVMMPGYENQIITPPPVAPILETQSASVPMPRKGQRTTPGQVQFSSPQIQVMENQGKVTLLVKREGGSDGEISVSYASMDSSATQGIDYQAVKGNLRWADGETSLKRIELNLIDDNYLEEDKSFIITLFEPTGGAELSTLYSMTVNIQDDESPAALRYSGWLEFEQSKIRVEENQGTITIPVTRKGGSYGTVSASYFITNGSAIRDKDYQVTEGKLTWLAGDMSPKSIEITLIDDDYLEGNELFTVTLSNPTNGAELSGVESITVSIEDDEPETAHREPSEEEDSEQPSPEEPTDEVSPVESSSSPGDSTTIQPPIYQTIVVEPSYAIVQFEQVYYQVVENETLIKVMVTLTPPEKENIFQEITVTYQIKGNDAQLDQDFSLANQALTGELTWAVGDDAPKTIEIQLINDDEIEGTETVVLVLSNPSDNVVIGPFGGTVVSILDDDEEPSTDKNQDDNKPVELVCPSPVQTPQTPTLSCDCLDENGNAVTSDNDLPTVIIEKLPPSEVSVEPQTAEKICSLQFPQSIFLQDENQTTLNIQVTRQGDCQGAVSVDYETRGALAKLLVDYTRQWGTLHWAAGDFEPKVIQLTITDDVQTESLEWLYLELKNPQGDAQLGYLNQAILAIEDDDKHSSIQIQSPPKTGVIQFADILFKVNESKTEAVITLIRKHGNFGRIEVAYAQADKSAKTKEDYITSQGILVWENGDTAPKTFTIPIVDDLLVEGMEFLHLKLTDPFKQGILGPRSQALLVIEDNDEEPPIEPQVCPSIEPPVCPAKTCDLPSLGIGKVINLLEEEIVDFNQEVEFAGGVAKPGKPYHNINWFDTDDIIDIKAQIKIAPEHIGQSADLLVAFSHQQEIEPAWYLFNQQGIPISWHNETLAKLPAWQQIELSQSTLEIVSPKVRLEPGYWEIYFGYRLENQIIFNGYQPIRMIVNSF